MIIVSDTSPLSGLAVVGYLPLLQKLSGKMTTQHQPINLKIENATIPEHAERQTIAIQFSWVRAIATPYV